MDDSISIAKVLEFAKQLDDIAQRQIENFINKLGLSGEKVVHFSDITKGAGKVASKALHEVAEAANNLFISFSKGSEIGKEMMSSFDGLGKSIAGAFKEADIGMSDVAIGTLQWHGLIEKSITGMGKLGDSGYEAGSKIKTSFESIAPVFDKAFEGSGFKNFVHSVIEGRDHVISLERELINMSIAQGRASDVSDTANHRFIDMNKSYEEYIAMSAAAARETGQTVASVMELNKALSSIPGSLHDGEQTTKVSQMAAAAGMAQLDVAKQLVEMYSRLGTNEKDATEALAYMHDKAGDSKLRMEAFNDTVLTIAGSFKMLGDNTNATTNFVNAFDKAFQDSKISPDAMKEVITSIGQGIEKMDVAKRAFVSGATGGPGGLAGAIQMQYAIQEGHVDEVVKKTMLAMQSQFGGQVVTMKDAAQNPALAGEYFKQTQYLTQVAGIAKDDKEASRILEAMKSGVMDILKPGAAEGEKGLALERQLGKGHSIQEKTQTTLMGIHQTLEVASAHADKVYSTQFEHVDEYLGKIAGSMGFNVKNRTGDIPSAYTGVTAIKGGPEGTDFSRHKPAYWNQMMGTEEASEKTIKHAHNIYDKMLGVGVDETGQTNAIRPNIMRHHPVPGTESGVSNIAPGHRNDLGLPELPKLTLPTTAKEDVMGGALPPLVITHKFEPIQIDIIGIGDQVISKTIDAKISSSEARRVGQIANGK